MVRLVTNNRRSGTIEQDSFRVSRSKSILDQIDVVLSEAIGMTQVELDFVINYDIKYRMGLSGSANEDSDD